jgi:hypothetical protein
METAATVSSTLKSEVAPVLESKRPETPASAPETLTSGIMDIAETKKIERASADPILVKLLAIEPTDETQKMELAENIKRIAGLEHSYRQFKDSMSGNFVLDAFEKLDQAAEIVKNAKNFDEMIAQLESHFLIQSSIFYNSILEKTRGDDKKIRETFDSIYRSPDAPDEMRLAAERMMLQYDEAAAKILASCKDSPKTVADMVAEGAKLNTVFSAQGKTFSSPEFDALFKANASIMKGEPVSLELIAQVHIKPEAAKEAPKKVAVIRKRKARAEKPEGKVAKAPKAPAKAETPAAAEEAAAPVTATEEAPVAEPEAAAAEASEEEAKPEVEPTENAKSAVRVGVEASYSTAKPELIEKNVNYRLTHISQEDLATLEGQRVPTRFGITIEIKDGKAKVVQLTPEYMQKNKDALVGKFDQAGNRIA